MARKQLFGVKLDQESIGTRELPVTSRSPVLMLMAAEERWYFTKEEINNSPSRRCGIDAEKELSYRQQGANLIQDMGQRLQVNQLAINTAIVYMHRFYMYHPFTRFHRNSIAPAALFLAAKVEEQPRKLEHVIKVAYHCLFRDQPPLDTQSEAYLERAQELVVNENILLQTLGFDVAIDHPHTHVVKCCQLVRATKDLAQTSYFMATSSLHMTTMCLQYKPTVVACVCIYIVCTWSHYEIQRATEGKDWFWYVDKSVTLELLETLTAEFLAILDKCPNRLKKIMNSSQHTDDRSKSSQGGSSSSSLSSSRALNLKEYNEKREKERREREKMRDRDVVDPREGRQFTLVSTSHSSQSAPPSTVATIASSHSLHSVLPSSRGKSSKGSSGRSSHPEHAKASAVHSTNHKTHGHGTTNQGSRGDAQPPLEALRVGTADARQDQRREISARDSDRFDKSNRTSSSVVDGRLLGHETKPSRVSDSAATAPNYHNPRYHSATNGSVPPPQPTQTTPQHPSKSSSGSKRSRESERRNSERGEAELVPMVTKLEDTKYRTALSDPATPIKVRAEAQNLAMANATSKPTAATHSAPAPAVPEPVQKNPSEHVLRMKLPRPDHLKESQPDPATVLMRDRSRGGEDAGSAPIKITIAKDKVLYTPEPGSVPLRTHSTTATPVAPPINTTSANTTPSIPKFKIQKSRLKQKDLFGGTSSTSPESSPAGDLARDTPTTSLKIKISRDRLRPDKESKKRDRDRSPGDIQAAKVPRNGSEARSTHASPQVPIKDLDPSRWSSQRQ
ncbi:putative formin-J isoform X4 [Penaeus vannamei]|uniref:Putative formin-J isoform X4 n=1 Tax=Penaeus vannamei TaxID=6689 RepID=A0A423TEZ6_PENVA|nr:putative formin-J isoform X4 [Penaeus vannamei]